MRESGAVAPGYFYIRLMKGTMCRRRRRWFGSLSTANRPATSCEPPRQLAAREALPAVSPRTSGLAKRMYAYKSKGPKSLPRALDLKLLT
jgi:hypothetical protein